MWLLQKKNYKFNDEIYCEVYNEMPHSSNLLQKQKSPAQWQMAPQVEVVIGYI